MKVLVIGVGVIGSYLVHALCSADNEVTVLARGSWANTLRTRGLTIHHLVQHKTTVDHPRVVEELAPGERYDVAFSVMRQDQQIAALPLLKTVDASLLVLVGNNVRAREAADFLEKSAVCRRVLFGFQSTAGVREGQAVTCVRWGATGLDVGPLHGDMSEQDKALLSQVFTGGYKPHFTHDFEDWLLCHAATVLPMCYASYLCGCNMHAASNGLLGEMVDAQAEGYALLTRLGFQILPEGDADYFGNGFKGWLWRRAVWLIAHTRIGTLCVDEHCMHAPDEMQALDQAFRELRQRCPGLPMPAWDRLYGQMGGWDAVLSRWKR